MPIGCPTASSWRSCMRTGVSSSQRVTRSVTPRTCPESPPTVNWWRSSTPMGPGRSRSGTSKVSAILSHKVTFAWGLAWSPDSSEVWYSGSDTLSGYDRAIYALSRDGDRRLVARVPGPITIQDIAPDGTGALVMSGAGWTSLTIVRAGQTQEQTLDLLGRTDFFTLSDDGKWILAHDNREGGEGIYKLSTDGRGRG